MIRRSHAHLAAIALAAAIHADLLLIDEAAGRAEAKRRNLRVTGTLGVSSNATVGGTLGVTGATTLGGALSVGGDISAIGHTITVGTINADTIAANTGRFS